MNENLNLLEITRRHFFGQCSVGLGALALGSLFAQDSAASSSAIANPLAPKKPHFPPKAKSVIFLFMAGGPSQLELFDYKPILQKHHDQPIPQSYIEGKRFAFMDSFSKEVPKLLGTRRKFQQYGQSGAWVSECLPHIAGIVDDISFIKTVATDVFNHAPAKLFANTGTQQFGRPSMGSWITYGIGSESENLPGFVVLQSGPRGPRGGAPLWGSGFLPTTYQGVPFRQGNEPILYLHNPEGVNRERQRATIDTIQKLNLRHLAKTQDPEISTRIASYEMAYSMQSSAPELIDISDESEQTISMYGIEPGKPSFASNCLLARRLVERGARFIQLYHTNWDHHGGVTENLEGSLDTVCKEIDQPCAALIQDLKQRGLIEDTLVIWGGEFGRTPMGEVRDTVGRNHHIETSTLWFAGGGTKPGVTIGETDELGFFPTQDRVHMHDIHATILHLLGLDHTQLTYRFQGRDFRLTDVAGNVIKKLLA